MIYMRVKWMHTIPTEPECIYSELDSARRERRKVEVYIDGQMGFADGSRSVDGSMLSSEPLPTLDEISTDPQFAPMEISKEEFESVWAAALAAHLN